MWELGWQDGLSGCSGLNLIRTEIELECQARVLMSTAYLGLAGPSQFSKSPRARADPGRPFTTSSFRIIRRRSNCRRDIRIRSHSFLWWFSRRGLHGWKSQMNKLPNAFSLLQLDVADDKVDTSIVISVDENRTPNGTGKGKKTEDSLENKSKYDSSLDNASAEYSMPLVWIDLEMTGLDVEVDRILEIACIITDGNLTKSIEGPDFVINQTKECLDKMGEWCQEHHGASGLADKVLLSTITEAEAEKQVSDFVKKHVGTSTPLLAGNSIYTDFLFLKKYMPDLASLFSHVLVDVSSVKALCMRWYPKDNKKAPRKKNNHRAMDDIKESIVELKYFKEHIFKPKGKK